MKKALVNTSHGAKPKFSEKNLKWIFIFLLVFGFHWNLSAQEKESKAKPIPKAMSFVTNHQINNGGKTINYKSTASEIFLKNDSGDTVASIWSVAYTVPSEKNRPVTFIFNGGPGSASMWLHMGMFGPKRVIVSSEATEDDGAAPYNLVDNTAGILDLTDLVFIDPVGTGYSRVVGKGKETDFWGVNEDAQSVAKFIRQWVTDNNRWFSKKYIAGESYGTTRAAAVSNALEGNGQNMALNGLILISQALDYSGSTSEDNNITSFITYLPSMATTAWYHKKAGQGKKLEDFAEECRQFTYNVYIPALYKGALLDKKEKEQVAEKLAYFTGLDKAYILKSNLRILMPRFQMKLMADKGLALGRLDGRFLGDEVDKVADRPHLGDASGYQASGAYTAALNYYFATDLEVKMDRPYITSNGKVGAKWNFRSSPKGSYWEPSRLNVAPKLAETMKRNPKMRVMVANGYFDLMCPFFDAEYTFSRNGIDFNRVEMKYYESGHMIYMHEPDFQKLTNDIRQFLSE